MSSVRKLRKKHNLRTQRFIAKINVLGSVRVGKNFKSAVDSSLAIVSICWKNMISGRKYTKSGITTRIIALSFGKPKRQRRSTRLAERLRKNLGYTLKRNRNEVQQTA